MKNFELTCDINSAADTGYEDAEKVINHINKEKYSKYYNIFRMIAYQCISGNLKDKNYSEKAGFIIEKFLKLNIDFYDTELNKCLIFFKDDEEKYKNYVTSFLIGVYNKSYELEEYTKKDK